MEPVSFNPENLYEVPKAQQEDVDRYLRARMTAAQLVAGVDEETQWLVDGLIPMEAITIFASETKGGKTTMLCSIMEQMQSYGMWAGRKVMRGSAWMHTEEGPITLVQAINTVGPKPVTWDSHWFITTTSEAFGMPWERFCAAVAHVYEMVVEQMTGEDGGLMPPKLIVFDTIGSWANLEDTNDYAAVGKAFHYLKALRQITKAAIVVTTHINKKGSTSPSIQNILGSTNFAGQADHIIFMTRDREKGVGGPRYITTNGRFRDADNDITLSLDTSDYQYKEVEKEDTAAALLLLIPPEGLSNRGWKEAAQTIGIGTKRFSRLSGELIEQGRVVRNGYGETDARTRWLRTTA